MTEQKKEKRGGVRVAGPGKKLGAPLQGTSKRKKTSITLQEEILEKLDKSAKITGKTRSLIIEELIGRFLKHITKTRYK